jgi:nitrite reductase (NADH) small subunit
MSAAAGGAGGDAFCLGPEDGIPEGAVRVFQVGGVEVGLLRVLGQLRAFENHCPHQGGPVCLGEVLGRQEAVLDQRRRIVRERLSGEHFDLICPWHGYSFDAMSGECVVDRRLRLRTWDVAVRDGQVYVRRRA